MRRTMAISYVLWHAAVLYGIMIHPEVSRCDLSENLISYFLYPMELAELTINM